MYFLFETLSFGHFDMTQVNQLYLQLKSYMLHLYALAYHLHLLHTACRSLYDRKQDIVFYWYKPQILLLLL